MLRHVASWGDRDPHPANLPKRAGVSTRGAGRDVDRRPPHERPPSAAASTAWRSATRKGLRSTAVCVPATASIAAVSA